jgi:hypothetical protein
MKEHTVAKIIKSAYMKKFIFLLSLTCFLFLYPLLADENVEEIQISTKEAFFIHYKGNKTQPSPSELELYISTFYPDEYTKYKQNEFEWKKLQEKILGEINQEINNLKQEAIFIIEINAVVGNYDFKKEGFPIYLSRDFASYGWETSSYGNTIYVDIGGSAGTFGGLRVALYLKDFDKYKFAKVSPDEAKAFLDNRNNLYSEYGLKFELYRSVTLVAYFKLGNFTSSEYKGYLKAIPGYYTHAIPGIIDHIEIWDLASVTPSLQYARNVRKYQQIGQLIMDK